MTTLTQEQEGCLTRMREAAAQGEAFFVINPVRTILIADKTMAEIMNASVPFEGVGSLTQMLTEKLRPMVAYVSGRDPDLLNRDGKSLGDAFGTPDGVQAPTVTCDGQVIGRPKADGSIDYKILGPKFLQDQIKAFQDITGQFPGTHINLKPHPGLVATISFNASSVPANQWQQIRDAVMQVAGTMGLEFGFDARPKDNNQIVIFIPKEEYKVSRGYGAANILDQLPDSKNKSIFVIGYDADPALDAGIAPILHAAGYNVTDICVTHNGSDPYGDIVFDAKKFVPAFAQQVFGIDPRSSRLQAAVSANPEARPA